MLNTELLDKCVDLPELHKNDIISLDEYFYSIYRDNVLTPKDKDLLGEYLEKFKDIPSEYKASKNIMLSHMRSLIKYEREDYSDRVSQRQRKYINRLTKITLEMLGVFTTSIDIEKFKEIDRILEENNVEDIENISLERFIDIISKYNVDISIFSYEEGIRELLTGAHKGGGGCDHLVHDQTKPL